MQEELPAIDLKYLKSLQVKELPALAAKIRSELVSSSMRNGGHLASNLGVVELTLAIHYVFESPSDKIIFDVGHQCYTHKMLTGRDIQKIRTCDVSGFPLMSESVHDAFGAGHSSTSLSAGMGIAAARDLSKENYHVVTVTGDASISNGVAFEALNNIGAGGVKMIMILNDNKMSISKNVGGLSKMLGRIRLNKGYLKAKRSLKSAVSYIPIVGKSLNSAADRIKKVFKFAFVHSRWFEELGIKYIGPIDGHNIYDLVDILRRCKTESQPILIHAITVKGKGMESAEQNPEVFHGISVDSGGEYSFSGCAGEAVTELADIDAKVVAVTSAMTAGTGLSGYAEKYPDRFFDTGIAESHAVVFCAGLCAGGYKPYYFVYSTFLQRGFDGILHDAALQKLPVRFLIDRAGLVGADGATHQGIFDLSYLRLIPGLVITAPKDTAELKEIIRWSQNIDFPLAVRYPKSTSSKPAEVLPVELGTWEKIGQNKSSNIFLCVGDRMLSLADKVKTLLRGDAVIYNCRFVRPLDEKVLTFIKGKKIFTFEDNVFAGGFGSSVLEYYSKPGFSGQKIKCFSLGDSFIGCGDVSAQFDASGLSPEAVFEAVKRF